MADNEPVSVGMLLRVAEGVGFFVTYVEKRQDREDIIWIESDTPVNGLFRFVWDPLTNADQDRLLLKHLSLKGWNVEYTCLPYGGRITRNARQISFKCPHNEFLTRAVYAVLERDNAVR